jgi:hypothetical protein
VSLLSKRHSNYELGGSVSRSRFAIKEAGLFEMVEWNVICDSSEDHFLRNDRLAKTAEA